MRVVKEGDKGKVICNSCGLSQMTYLLRDVDFSDQRGTVKNILAGVCDKCGDITSVPPQSVPKIKEEFNKAMKSVESRVPAHYIDILNLAVMKISSDLSDSFKKHLILYYMNILLNDVVQAQELNDLFKYSIAQAKNSKRLSFKVTENTYANFHHLSELTGLGITDVIKGLVLKIYEDIVEPETPDPINMELLRTFATMYQ